LPDNQILIGLTGALLPAESNLRLLREDGTAIESFRAELPSGYVEGIEITPDQKILLGFRSSLQKLELRRLNRNGTADLSFTPLTISSTASQIERISLLSNGEIEVVTGTRFCGFGCRRVQEFFRVGGQQISAVPLFGAPDRDRAGNAYWPSSSGLIRLKPDGSIDQTFPSFRLDEPSSYLAAQSNGQAIVSAYDGQTTSLARILPVAAAQRPALIAFSSGAYETSGSVNVLLHRMGDTSQPLKVQARTIEASATPGQDFVPQDTSIEFVPLQVTANISIALLDDGKLEGPEDFSVAFTARTPEGEELLSAESRISLYDDEISNSSSPSRAIYMGVSAGGVLILNFSWSDLSRTVEASEDFVTWTTVAEYPANGQYQMVVPQDRPHRFYRVRFK